MPEVCPQSEIPSTMNFYKFSSSLDYIDVACPTSDMAFFSERVQFYFIFFSESKVYYFGST